MSNQSAQKPKSKTTKFNLLPGNARLSPTPWEAKLLGAPAFRLEFGSSGIVELERAALLVEATKQAISFASNTGAALVAARVSVTDTEATSALEGASFRFIECYQMFSRPLNDKGPANLPGFIREATKADAASLAAIGARSFVHSRFHSDRAIPSSVANESRAQWVVNSVNNPEHHVLMAVSNNIPTGFVVSRRTDGAEGAEARLDIIAVDPEFRQQGIGAGLVAAFLMRARQIGCGVAIVGTQAHNIKSVQMYEKQLFRLCDCHYSFHWTPDNA